MSGSQHPEDFEIPPESVARIENLVRDYATTLGRPAFVKKARHVRLLPLLAVAAALAMITMMVFYAAEQSLPDQRLYLVKRAMEAVQLELSSDTNAFAADLAQRRIDEFERMMVRNQIEPVLLEQANTYLIHVMDNAQDDTVLLARVRRVGLYQTELIREAVPMANADQREALLRIGQRTADLQAEVATFLELPAGQDATIVIEGPVEAIGPDYAVIYGIEIKLDPTGILIGDVLRIEGQIDLETTTFTIRKIN